MAVRATDSADYTGLELLLAQGLTPVGGIKQLAQRIVTRSENDLREAYGSVALPTVSTVMAAMHEHWQAMATASQHFACRLSVM